MGFANSKVEVALLLSVAAAINLFFFYGLVTRPVVEYNLSTPLGYNETVDFESGDLLVNLETANKGFSPARVAFVVRLYNMSLTGPEEVESAVENGFVELYIPLEKTIKQSGNYTYPIMVKSSREATYLVLILSVESRPRWDPLTGFYDSFAIFEPKRPTALLLRHVGGERFMRVRSR